MLRPLVALALAAACARPLPPTLEIEDVAATLAHDDAPLPAGARWEELDPGEALRADGARESLVVTPGTAATWRVTLPEGAALRFGVGVEGEKKSDDARTGIRFAVSVDGKTAFERTVNPASDRHDRRWFDERIDLAAAGGRTVELRFATDAPDGGAVAGRPGWSRVRVVRTTRVARQTARRERPNVVVVVVDTLRADVVGPGGASPSPTPRLDRFADDGLVFTQAVAQSSWTLQSVASLMTGMHSRTHGATGRHGGRAHEAAWGVLGDEAVTWAELAARAGITTVGVSANPLVSRGTNLAQGFETFVELPWDPEGRNWPAATDVNAAFLSWLRANDGYRFVAYLHYMEPHDPYTPPDPPPSAAGVRPALARGWIRDLANRVNWERTDVPSAEELAHLRARYRGEVAVWDAAFGALVDALADRGLADRTVVIVTADHGEEFLEHGRLTHGSQLYDETVRVPLVVGGPGIAAARRDDLVQGIDLLPTLSRLLDFAPPAHAPGRSLLDARVDERPAIIETSSGIAADGGPFDLVAVRTSRWKLLEIPVGGRRELYDLSRDGGEREDIAATATADDELAEMLAAWHARTPATATAARRPDLVERLRALGYAR